MNQIIAAVIIVPAISPVSIYQALTAFALLCLGSILTIIIIGCLSDLTTYINRRKKNSEKNISDKRNESNRRKKVREEFDKASNW